MVSELGYLLLLVSSCLLVAVPRRYAAAVFMGGLTYLPLAEALAVGPLHVYSYRLLLLVGLARVFCRAEWYHGRLVSLDKALVAAAVFAALSTFFHSDVAQALIFRAGFAFDTLCLYLLLRCWLRDCEDVSLLFKGLLVLLVPVAACMAVERVTGRNPFSILGGLNELSAVRNDRIRASGPFRHSILAGTVGATCFPLALVVWRENRRIALAGMISCLLMVVASNSSGPIITFGAVVLSLFLWRWRRYLKPVLWASLFGIIGLHIVMKAPVWYLIARIDFVGGSTGDHRARLIDSAIKYFREWWFFGTDYTRHWMPTGIQWSEDHTDITNQYLFWGVIGGLPLMLTLCWMIIAGFRLLWRTYTSAAEGADSERWLIWVMGSCLFAHSVTFISVTYHDQSRAYFYMLLAAIAAVACSPLASQLGDSEPEIGPNAGFSRARREEVSVST